MVSTKAVNHEMWDQIELAAITLNQAVGAATAEPVGVETTKAILKTLVETLRALASVAQELENSR